MLNLFISSPFPGDATISPLCPIFTHVINLIDSKNSISLSSSKLALEQVLLKPCGFLGIKRPCIFSVINKTKWK